MNILKLSLLALVTCFGVAFAGDDASGPVRYSVNLGDQYESHKLSAKDQAWSQSLVQKLKYTGPVVHFVRTTLPLSVNGKQIVGVVYQALEKPEFFYIAAGDAMLKLNTESPYSPGVGGFSMHAPPSKNFIVCLNFQPGGVPFLTSTRVVKGVVTWGGNEYKRI